MRVILFGLLAMIVSLNGYNQNIPEGYLLQYQQDFSNLKSLDDFSMNRPWSWGISRLGKNSFLSFNGSDSASNLPLNMAVLKNKVFGDFILEADLLAVKDTGQKGTVCFFLGIRDSSKYYYAQLTTRDSAVQGIYLVKDSLIKPLITVTKTMSEWKSGFDHKIRLERNIVRRTITVFIDNMEHPVLFVKDFELVMGGIGIGTFSGPARFDNLKIWAPTVITDAQLKEMYGK
jgi:hypothetical protein